MIELGLHLLTLIGLVSGTFFLFVGALGIWRLPDVYHRIHAGTKGVTLGLIGLLVATVANDLAHGGGGGWRLALKAILIVAFQFIAAPVAAHTLGRAAHLANAPQTPELRGDELAEDEPDRSGDV